MFNATYAATCDRCHFEYAGTRVPYDWSSVTTASMLPSDSYYPYPASEVHLCPSCSADAATFILGLAVPALDRPKMYTVTLEEPLTDDDEVEFVDMNESEYDEWGNCPDCKAGSHGMGEERDGYILCSCCSTILSTLWEE